ncbi:hypothetical protein ACFVR1_11375 [Psychrobacillus sp. NPDC058041]
MTTLTPKNPKTRFYDKFGVTEVRLWYKTHDKSIPEKLNLENSIES